MLLILTYKKAYVTVIKYYRAYTPVSKGIKIDQRLYGRVVVENKIARFLIPIMQFHYSHNDQIRLAWHLA